MKRMRVIREGGGQNREKEVGVNHKDAQGGKGKKVGRKIANKKGKLKKYNLKTIN